MRLGNSLHHDSAVFSLRDHGSDPWRTAGHGAFRGADGTVGDRNGRYQDPVDLCVLPAPQISVFSLYFLSGFLDRHNSDAGGMLLFRQETVQKRTAGGKLKTGSCTVMDGPGATVPFLAFSKKIFSEISLCL